MKVKELKLRLQKEKFNPHCYNVDGGKPLDGYGLVFRSGLWVYFTFERGIESNQKMFLDESDACEYFYNAINEDPTVKP
ncbi:hypothetical protein [Shewanella piezotolerans]|uniref:hypothetical protein n=1 Tax=Shewanella piezotolerans TaxID=404011 RepID=UPI000319EE87|nr:hypothetical protein [Shewanella piezotolerans]